MYHTTGIPYFDLKASTLWYVPLMLIDCLHVVKTSTYQCFTHYHYGWPGILRTLVKYNNQYITQTLDASNLLISSLRHYKVTSLRLKQVKVQKSLKMRKPKKDIQHNDQRKRGTQRSMKHYTNTTNPTEIRGWTQVLQLGLAVPSCR